MTRNENKEVNMKKIKVTIKNYYFITLQNESIGTSRRRTQPFTGRGGAPKFFLNWLTFAL